MSGAEDGPQLALVNNPLEPETLAVRAAMSRVHSNLFGEGLDPVRLGRYRIIHRIDGGAFGSVYAAFDPRLDRKVALKIYPPIDHAVMVDRVLAEARALAKVVHPNVVTVFDAGRVEDEGEERLFVSMEFVDGVNVADWAAGGRSCRQIIDMIRAAASGLGAAHGSGLIHLDVKPTNLLVDAEGRVRVIDFGLARRSGPGSARGTPHTMAPEQHEAGHADARTDVYGLAATAWWTLYGEPPFTGTAGELLRNKRERPPRVGARRDVPAWVRRALADALNPDPAQRPETMTELRHRLTPRWRRRGVLIAGVSALATAGAVAGGLGWRSTSDARAATIDRLTREARDAGARAYFVYPPSHDPTQRSAYMAVVELEALDHDEARARGRELRQEFAETLVRLGDRYWDLPGGRPFSIDYYILATTFADHPRASSRALITAGELAALRSQATAGRFSEGQLRAADALIALADPDPQRRNAALRELSVRDRDLISGRPRDLSSVGVVEEEPAESSERMDAAVHGETPPSEPPPGEAPADSGSVDEAGDRVGGSKSGGRRPSSKSGSGPTETDARRETRLSLAAAAEAYSGGDWESAGREYRRALEASPRSLRALVGLSDVEYQRGRYSEALRWAERAAKYAPRRADVHLRLGDAARKTLELGKARQAYERAAELGSAAAESRLLRMDAG